MGIEEKLKTLTNSCQLKNIDSVTSAAIVQDFHSTKTTFFKVSVLYWCWQHHWIRKEIIVITHHLQVTVSHKYSYTVVVVVAVAAVITPAKEVLCSPMSVWLVGLSAGLHKIYSRDFLTTWMKEESQPRIDPLGLLVWIWMTGKEFLTFFYIAR